MGDLAGLHDWGQIAAACTALSILGGFLAAVVRMQLARNFVSHQDHSQLDQRLKSVERKLDGAATREDMRQMESRLHPVEMGIGVMNAEIRAAVETGQRTEHMVSILFSHLLQREEPKP